MGIEVPRLPIQPGETISLEELFKHVGGVLFRQGLVPEEFASDEWAQSQAFELGKQYTASPPTAQPNDKEK